MIEETAFQVLRMDDVGAASKIHEVYGRTRFNLGPLPIPVPGNFLFLKHLPPFKKWGPYPELSPAQWEDILALLARRRAKLTVGVTACWVESDGGLIPFPEKYPEQTRFMQDGVRRGLLEIANHGLTHCVVQDRAFRPRWFTSNRRYHREFWDWIAPEIQSEHLHRSQTILEQTFGVRPQVLVPPGNVFTETTLELARREGLKFLSCHAPTGPAGPLYCVGDEDLIAFHDREIALYGLSWLERRLRPGRSYEFVSEAAEKLRSGAAA